MNSLITVNLKGRKIFELMSYELLQGILDFVMFYGLSMVRGSSQDPSTCRDTW